jgi:hypothetical protein
MFAPYSIESRLAVAGCILLPYLVMFLICRADWQSFLKFKNALIAFIMFTGSFVLVSSVIYPVLPHPRIVNSPSVSLDYAMVASMFVFPALPILIGGLFFMLVTWRVYELRYFFIALFGLGQFFYLLNIVKFMANAELGRL